MSYLTEKEGFPLEAGTRTLKTVEHENKGDTKDTKAQDKPKHSKLTNIC